MSTPSSAELARYAKQAREGRQLGTAHAKRDRVARSPCQLMFLSGEEVLVLGTSSSDDDRKWIGYCEGVVGIVDPDDLVLDGPLKQPIVHAEPESPLDGRINALLSRSSRPAAAAPQPESRFAIRQRTKSTATLPPGLADDSDTPPRRTPSPYRPPRRQTSLLHGGIDWATSLAQSSAQPSPERRSVAASRPAVRHAPHFESFSTQPPSNSPMLPYLAVTPTGPVPTDSYFVPHHRTGSIASTASAVPTVLASPMLDAAATPSLNDLHAPVWGIASFGPPAPTKLPPVEGRPPVAAPVPAPVPVEEPPSPSLVLAHRATATPEWTSGSSSTSSEPSTPVASPVVQTAPRSPPVQTAHRSPTVARVPVPLVSVDQGLPTALNLISIRRPPTPPRPLMKNPSTKATKRARTISTPTLTLHTNRALEAAIGIPAVPHSPAMQSFLPKAAASAPTETPTAKPRERTRTVSMSPTSHVRASTVPFRSKTEGPAPTSLARPGEEVDEYGFFRPVGTVARRRDAFELESEEHRLREAKWLACLKTPASSARTSKKVRKLAKLGVPNSLRGKVWAHLLDVDEYRVPGVWEKLAAKGRLDETYDEIERDLCRSFPDHQDFRDPNSPMIADLRTLLRAFAQYSSQFEPRLRIGYAQGLGVVAGFFLMHCPGEEAFWILVAVVRRLCPGWWSSSLFGFRRDADVFARLLELHDPALAKHLADHNVDPNLYLPQQFLQLFIRTLPWPTLLRVMDVFVLDGPTLLLRLSLAIFHLHRDAVLARRSQTDILELLLDLPRSAKLDVDVVLPACFAVKIKPAQLARLRASSEKTATVKTIRRV